MKNTNIENRGNSKVTNLSMIEAFGLTKRYGKTVALAGIDLQVPAGSILGCLGPNGAGKTTAIQFLLPSLFPITEVRVWRDSM